MTSLIVNDQPPLELSTTEGMSLFDVLLAAQDAWESTQIITRLEVNDEPVEPLEEATLMAIPAHQAAIRITLETSNPRTIKDTLAEASAYLERLRIGFEDVAGRIRTGHDAEAHTMLGDGLQGMAMLLELVDNLHQKESVTPEMREDFERFLEGVNDKTREMTDAQESGDPTLIADIVEYEFIDAVVDLQRFLAKAAERL